MADLRKHSSTSNLIRFALKNSSTGAGLTGLSSASTGLIISTVADNEASATAYTVAGSTIESISTLGTFAAPTATKCRFKEVDATNHPGLYEFQIADARFSVSSAKRLVVSVSGATSLLATDYEVQLTQADVYDAVRAGLTALPNAAAEASGGLYTRGTGAGQIKQTNNGEIDANATRVSGTAQTAGDLAALINAIDDFVDTEVAAIKAVTDQFTAAQTEPSAVPAANATPLQKIAWLAALARNKITQTSSTQTLLADDGSTTIATATVSDDGTVFTRAEWA